MKRGIQEEILNEYRDVDEKEAYQKQVERISRNPRLAVFLKRVEKRQQRSKEVIA